MASTGLPSGWEVRHSNSKNLPYYFNAETRESRWEPPQGTDSEALKHYMANYHSSSAPPPRTQQNGESQTNGDTTNGKIRAAHLLIKHRDSRRPASWREANITRTKEEAMAMIKEHQQKIERGEVNLQDLVTRESDCSSARKKGDLGYFGRGDMQKEFEEAAFALKPGQMSGIVTTASGLHLIQRLE